MGGDLDEYSSVNASALNHKAVNGLLARNGIVAIVASCL